MAITATTLPYAINRYQTAFELASTSGVTASNEATGAGLTYLYIGTEMARVISVPVSGRVVVERGVQGTVGDAHGASSSVLIGAPADFPLFTPEVRAFETKQFTRFGGVFAPVAAAATLTPPTSVGRVFHVTGTTQTNVINLPPTFVEGIITIIADGAWSWGTSAAAGGIAVAGSVTAGSAVSFIYDAATALWYPASAGVFGSNAVSAPVAAAAVLAASGTLFHVTGTTATTTITPPSNFNAQAITIIADAAWTWTSTTSANGIAQTGAVTSAGEAVQFVYDAGTALWYPNRRA